MEPDHSLLSLNRKNLLGALYVGVALALIGPTAGYAQSQVQWWNSAQQLDITVEAVNFRLGSTALDVSLVLVNAFLANPTRYDGLKLLTINYAVYVNSTTESFSPVSGSSQVAAKEQPHERIIPASGSLDISTTLPVYTDAFDALRQFLNAHPADLKTFTQIDIALQSSWGPFLVSYCYEKPDNRLTICPPPPQEKHYGG